MNIDGSINYGTNRHGNYASEVAVLTVFGPEGGQVDMGEYFQPREVFKSINTGILDLDELIKTKVTEKIKLTN